MKERFRLGLRRRFQADHALVGGDWGAENQRHSHQYLWEIRLEAPELDQHGYLIDLVTLEQAADAILGEYSGVFLNELPGWKGMNPSVERTARALGQALQRRLGPRPGLRIESLLWENDHAWASWTQE